MRIVLFTLLSFFLPHNLLGNSDAAKELDDRQAVLNERKSRSNEIAVQHGKFALIRDREVYGDQGHFENVRSWYLDLNAWFHAWSKIVSELNEDTYKNESKSKLVIGLVQAQLDALHELDAKRDRILGDLDRTRKNVGNLIRYSPAYLEGFHHQIVALNNNFDRLTLDVTSTRDIFARQSLERHRELCGLVIELLEDRIFLALTDFSSLRELLQKIRFSYDSYNQIEIYRFEVQREVLSIRDLYLNQRQPLTAMKRLAELEARVGIVKDHVRRQEQFLPPFREGVIESIEYAYSSLKAELEWQESDFPSADKFRQHYAEDVYTFGSTKGLAERCKNQDSSLNCAAMREILFYPATNLESLTSEQLLYVEQQLVRVKSGFTL